MGKIMVHGFMVYKCRKCGKEFRMWCEKGIEEHGKDHKPSPFTILCPCGDLASDISFMVSVKNSNRKMIEYDAGYMELPEGESYFANVKGRDCGIPHLAGE